MNFPVKIMGCKPIFEGGVTHCIPGSDPAQFFGCPASTMSLDESPVPVDCLRDCPEVAAEQVFGGRRAGADRHIGFAAGQVEDEVGYLDVQLNLGVPFPKVTKDLRKTGLEERVRGGDGYGARRQPVPANDLSFEGADFVLNSPGGPYGIVAGKRRRIAASSPIEEPYTDPLLDLLQAPKDRGVANVQLSSGA